MKFIFLALSLTLAAGGPIKADAVHAQNSGLIDTAKTIVEKLVAEDFCAVSERFESKLKQSLTTDKLQEVWANLIFQIGMFKRQLDTETEKVQEGYDAILVRCEFDKSVGTVRVIFDGEKNIVGLWVAPYSKAATPPAQPAALSQSGSAEAEFKAEAKRVLDLLVAENFSQIWGMFNEQMKKGLSVEKMREVWASVIQNVGSYKRVTDSQYGRMDGYDVVAIKCEFERGHIQVRVAYDGQKKIGGLYVLPAQ